MLSFSYREIFSGDTLKLRYTNQIRTRYRNWRTTSATQFAVIKITMLHRVYRNVIRRTQLCIDAEGNQFQHLLLWYILSAFGYRINFCIYAMLRTRATFSWPTLYMYVGCLHKLYVTFSSFNQKWIFSTDTGKIPIYNLKEICPVSAKVFHVERNTNPTKFVLVYRNCLLKTLQKFYQFRFLNTYQVAADLR